jgi:hypothetical protein
MLQCRLLIAITVNVIVWLLLSNLQGFLKFGWQVYIQLLKVYVWIILSFYHLIIGKR